MAYAGLVEPNLQKKLGQPDLLEWLSFYTAHGGETTARLRAIRLPALLLPGDLQQTSSLGRVLMRRRVWKFSRS